MSDEDDIELILRKLKEREDFTMSSKDVIELILRKLKEKNMSIADLARESGLARQTVHRLLKSDLGQVKLETVQRLAMALDVDVLLLMELWLNQTSETQRQGLTLAAYADAYCKQKKIAYIPSSVDKKLWYQSLQSVSFATVLQVAKILNVEPLAFIEFCLSYEANNRSGL